MIYVLSYNIEEKIYSCSGEYESLFHIFLALREKYRNTQTLSRDMYIRCINAQGATIDLKQGIFPRLASKGQEEVLITKGLQAYCKYPEGKKF